MKIKHNSNNPSVIMLNGC